MRRNLCAAEAFLARVPCDFSNHFVLLLYNLENQMDGLTRAVFEAAKTGDATAMVQMADAARDGSKNAEAILLQLTRENMLATREENFASAFRRVTDANELLHRAYLNVT